MIETYKATIQENGVYIIKKFKVQEATPYRLVNCDLFFFHVYHKCEGSKAIIN
jgi:hypothetical protein